MPFAGHLGQFLRLVMRHGRVAASAWPRLAQWLALCVALQWAVRRDEERYEAAVSHIDVPDDPVFVLGHWRSGTTYLHYLLALDRENFAYPSNYQCLFPTVFLTLGEGSWLYRRLAARLPRTRPMDSVVWDLAAPQEDELVYLPAGGPNPFHESMVFPLTARVDAEAFLRQSTDARTREITLRFFRKLTFVHGRRLVAKSPGHLFRLPILRALFPRSRVIFIVRDPYEVVPSMEHMKGVFRQHMSLQGSHIVDYAATIRLMSLYFAVMHERLNDLPAAHHALVRYEDLLRDPIGTVQGLYDHLGLPYSAAFHRELIAYAAAAREHEPNRFDPSPAVSALVEAECGDILARYGFGRRNSAA